MISEEIEQLTTSQAELLPKMEKFLDSKERIFLLTGKPGVGKTFMVKYVLADHIAADKSAGSYYNMNVAGVTLAHKAKNVLGQHIPNTFTFAKAFGMKEKINPHTGGKTFEYDKYAQDCVGRRSIPVFVHDEVSQYTDEMLKIVMENTPIFSKIIFIGDRAQLPPIDEDSKMGADADSPIFGWQIPEDCKHELTDRVRQAANNPILDLSDIIREEIFGKQNLQRVIDAIKQPRMIDGIGYDFLRYDDLCDHISGQEDPLNMRVLAYRNKTINKHNPIIRNHMLNTPEQGLVDGDIVTMTDNYYHWVKGEPRPKYVLYNSETFRLTKVHKSVMKKKVGGTKYHFDVYRANIEGKPNEQFITPTESGMEHFNQALSDIADRCKTRELKWGESFWPLKESVCQFTYGYAFSIHKAQGSTYDTIYCDANDIFMTGPLTPKRKLQSIYTAITRAKYDVYFLKR